MARRLPWFFILLLVSTTASARIVSYAPISNRFVTIPVMGHRLNRHFAVVESSSVLSSYSARMLGQLVLYDSQGEEEPRVVVPRFGSAEYELDSVTLREGPGDQQPQILISYERAWSLTVDGGRTWIRVALDAALAPSYYQNTRDVGGWYARGLYSNIRIGDDDTPFVVVTTATDGFRLVAIARDGTTRQLLTSSKQAAMSLLGSDNAGRRFLVRVGMAIHIVDPDGSDTLLGTAPSASAYSKIEGWISGAGAVYAEVWDGGLDIALWQLAPGVATFIDGSSDKTNPAATPPKIGAGGRIFFAVPTNDSSGAWIVKRLPGQPTRLLRHTPEGGLVEQWSDASAPEVEAIIPAPSPDKILIQVHRPRPTVVVPFRDPALAVWHVGDPAPRAYDELFLAEVDSKGFVHIDVDAAERGEPFVFDAGWMPRSANTVSAGGGGSDVASDAGVVRGSLRQRLVLPGFGHTAGAFGSFWRSDLTLYNPNDTPAQVTLRFVPAGAQVTASEANVARVQLAAREIRLIADAARALFAVDGAVGALFIEPDSGLSVNATGRTYNSTASGTYGYGMQAIDVFAAASARFPVSFAAAFQGSKFRTNLFLTDVSGRGTGVQLAADGPTGSIEALDVPGTSANGVMQLNGLGYLPFGALTVTPTRGQAIASLFSVDNLTNDPTFFPPDLAGGNVRTIPVVGHLFGANGSQFRSDLFLYNDKATPKSLFVEMHSWTSTAGGRIPVSLAPHEARMVTDVLKTWFGRTDDIARLVIVSVPTDADLDLGFHVTSRTYTVGADGGTYGFLMPPLNNFQMAAPGETLEILGTALDPRFRTNIGVFDTARAWTGAPTPRVRIAIVGANGTPRVTFEENIEAVAGLQLNDVFRKRGLALDGTPVLIRITPLQGMLGAYAAMLDNSTNDSMYFAANLAAAN